MNEKKQMERKLDGHTIEVSLPNKTGYERIAMECSAKYARMVGFVPEFIENLKSAVAEACINAMKHGNKWRPDTRVVVNMHFEDGAFSVSVMDEGDGMLDLPDESDVERKIEKLEPPKGLGIYLIKKLVDQVEFNKMTNDGHVVKMIIKKED